MSLTLARIGRLLLRGFQVTLSWSMRLLKGTLTLVGMTILSVLVVALVYLVQVEFQTSYFQSELFSSVQSRIHYSLQPASASTGDLEVSYPTTGPYNERLGYASLSTIADRFLNKGYQITERVVQSPLFKRLLKWGVPPPYPEKDVAGVFIADRSGATLFERKFPGRTYETFEDIPPLIWKTLLFIEDGKLLREDQPRYNPAVEWGRFGKAVGDLVLSQFNPEHDVHGGSTLATQKEKFRHSPDGITFSPLDKLRQMTAASLRAYSTGPQTFDDRQQVVLSYINSVPLAAVSGFGEVNGLGDGLWAYFGADFERLNRLLLQPVTVEAPVTLEEQSAAYHKVLSLFLAHRRPGFYLGKDKGPLKRQLARYIPLLYKEGIIPRALFRALQSSPLEFGNAEASKKTSLSFLEQKAATTVRTELLSLTGIPRLYDLDRVDLQVDSTLDKQVQQQITEYFLKLRDKEFARKSGLIGKRLFRETDDLSQVVYSLTLYEKTPDGNALRVQTDSFDQPFNINEGVLLDLGSTSKFRTLVTYLQVIEQLWLDYKDLPLAERRVKAGMDPLRRWVLQQLTKTPALSLEKLLDRGLSRKYSANPGEQFFTASGLHEFHNFSSSQDGRVFSVAGAMHGSVNLPLIRMMRDIVDYFSWNLYGVTSRGLSRLPRPRREELVSEYIRQEASQLVRKYYRRYKEKTPLEIEVSLLSKVRRTPSRTAAIRLLLHPEETLEQFSSTLQKISPSLKGAEARLANLYATWSGANLKLRSVQTGLHPYELFVAAKLFQAEQPSLTDLMAGAKEVTAIHYEWLRNAPYRTQRRALKIVLEQQAFEKVHQYWKKVGYRNRRLVPSLATSLGTSADQPASLAELMGIILHNGVRMPAYKISNAVFAEDTPYEISFRPDRAKGERVLSEAVAERSKRVLFDIVKKGTAVRLAGGIQGKRGRYMLGGKTGTGDNRIKKFGPGLSLKSSKAVNRTATFMFLIDDLMCGTITVFVEGEQADNYEFTSSLPVQILKSMGPMLAPLIDKAAAARK